MPRARSNLQPSVKKQRATHEELREWAGALQFAFVEALPQVTGWTPQQAIFHGGTSLAMCWHSPRFSEDLDFLLDEAIADDPAQLDSLFAKVLARMREVLVLTHPKLHIEMREKSRDARGRIRRHFVATQDDRFERSMMQVEMLGVSRAYLQGIDATYAFPMRAGDVITRSVTEIPVATQRALLADKIAAISMREEVKWRDIFDLHLLLGRDPEPIGEQAQRFVFHSQAYQGATRSSPRDALAGWLAQHSTPAGRAALVELSQTDLKRWLPAPLWSTLWPSGIARMVDTVCRHLQQVVHELDSATTQTETPPIRRRRTRQRGG